MPKPLFTIRVQLWGSEWVRTEVNTTNVPDNPLDDDRHVAFVDLGLSEESAHVLRQCLDDYLDEGTDDA